MSSRTSLEIRTLRLFGIAVGLAIAVAAGVVLPWLTARPRPLWPWLVGATLALVGAAAPRWLVHVHRAWMRVTSAIATVLTPVVAAIVFFGVFTPLGLVRRAWRRDPMSRRLDARASSYRIARSRAPASHMRRPY